jgi:hypothetical protein
MCPIILEVLVTLIKYQVEPLWTDNDGKLWIEYTNNSPDVVYL